MANDKDFIVKNAVEVGGNVKTTVGTVTSGTVGYYLAGASYDSKSFSVNAQAGSPQGLYFKSDGTKVYIVGDQGDSVDQFSLSTAWDISTASFDNVTFSLASQVTSPKGIFFKPDGTSFYVNGETVADRYVYQYNMTTAWDISTASYASKSFSITSDNEPLGLFFKSDGTKAFITGQQNNSVYQYGLSTAWDASTGSYDSVSFDFSATAGFVQGLSFSSDGTKLFLAGYDSTETTVFSYTLSTAWDLTTASYETSFRVNSQEPDTFDVQFSTDGTKMYIVGITNDTIYQYSTALNTQTLDLSTGNYFNDTLAYNTKYIFSNAGAVQSFQVEVTGGAIGYLLSAAAYDSKSFSVSSQESSPSCIQFKSDGTKMFVGGSTNDVIYQYSLSTAWDVSTTSYDSVSFSVTSQENNLRGLYIKPDGLKFYTIGIQADVVHQYTMSTAWDMSTASYDSVSFSVTSQEGEPQGISFKTDGTKMFVVGSLGDEVNEYSLSTAWDISTASFTTNFVISGQDTNPSDIYFKDDGTKFWISGDTNNTVYQYSCSTAWDISTASYDNVSFSVATQETGPQGITFGYNGTKLYVVGTSTDTVFQYSTGTDATLTWPTSLEWPLGITPFAPANGQTDLYTISTDDGGTTYIGLHTADNLS